MIELVLTPRCFDGDYIDRLLMVRPTLGVDPIDERNSECSCGGDREEHGERLRTFVKKLKWLLRMRRLWGHLGNHGGGEPRR